MIIKEISIKPWVYTLYKCNEDYVLSVAFCNGSVDYSRAFKIKSTDLTEEYLTKLAEAITSNYENYKEIEVKLPELSIKK